MLETVRKMREQGFDLDVAKALAQGLHEQGMTSTPRANEEARALLDDPEVSILLRKLV